MTPPSIFGRSRFQSTLSVRRATRIHSLKGQKMSISIHALRKESDLMREWIEPPDVISIHALRKESDVF